MERPDYLNRIQRAFSVTPVVALLGPRQCGKTTLARSFIKTLSSFDPANYFDLEDPTDLSRLESNPKLALSLLSGLIVIDEVQRIPELFPLLRVLVDQPNSDFKFLILGSASRELIRQSSETLAGRLTHIEVSPFTIQETRATDTLWHRGGFPKSYLAPSNEISWDWRKSYISTFLERDIPLLGIQIPPLHLRRFWMMLTNCHGNLLNSAELGNSLGISHTTVRRYLDILIGTFMIRQLQPWFENINKRQFKQPKIFFRDSGIFHALLGIQNPTNLHLHPKLGASWEGFALEQLISIHHAEPEDCYFWGVHGQSELDLLLVQGGKKQGFEIKFSQTPKITTSMKNALEQLQLDSLTIVVPGKANYPLSERIKVLGLENCLQKAHTHPAP